MHDGLFFLLLVYIVLNTGRIANKLDPQPGLLDHFGDWMMRPRKPPKPPGKFNVWWHRRGWWIMATAFFGVYIIAVRISCPHGRCG